MRVPSRAPMSRQTGAETRERHYRVTPPLNMQSKSDNVRF
jgi:hypothetical protein